MLTRLKAAFAVLFGSNPPFVSPASDPSASVRDLFADTRFQWRTIETLHTATGFASLDSTRALLTSMGARRSELAKEVYTLPTASKSIPFANDAELAIEAAFADERFTWRSIEALSKASGLSIDATRSLLADMGARRNSGEKEVYTLN